MIDSELLGKTSMDLLDHIEQEPIYAGGTVVAVGIVVVVESADGKQAYTRINCSDEFQYQQRGLFMSALKVVGEDWTPGEEEMEDDDEDED